MSISRRDSLINSGRHSDSPIPEDNSLSTRRILGLIGLAALTTLVLAVIPWLGFVNYSFRLLITLIHELGHGLTAIITGGSFNNFIISADGSGLAYTSGGWRLLVIPAGYLGAALFGALLIMLGRNHRWSRIAMAVIGLSMILLSLCFATPSIFRGYLFEGILTTVSGVIFGTLFLLVALKASAAWIIFLLHVVAIQAGLMAFSDIITVIKLATNTVSQAHSDAHAMAELTFIPALVWALLWAVVAVVIIGGAVWITWIAPLRKNNTKPPLLSHYG